MKYPMTDLLNQAVPDEKVIGVLAKILFEENETPGSFELEDKWMIVPRDTPLTITHKVFIHSQFDFGDHYVVQVAIGELEGIETGLLRTKYGCASLYG